MGSGGNWGATEAGESSELQYKWKRGGRRVFLGSPPLQEIWASPRKKQKQMGFKMDRLLYRPSRLPVFRTGGPCARGSPRHSPAYCPFERKKETPPAYGYSSVTFFNLASTKLEDAVLDADTHTGRVARQSEVSNNRPTIYLLDCEGSQASQHSH